MNDKTINLAFLPEFNGGWSYETGSIHTALSHTTYTENTINVLEFGSGDSTRKMFNFLKDQILNVNYECYETDPKYVTEVPCNTILYKHPSEVKLLDRIYDLILIDGPMGIDRKYWYEKIKPCCRPGTIILIDDWNHFAEFELELQKNLKYIVIEINDGKHPLKSFKIVKIV
ncbi:MAG: hypothetical protein WC905_00840 [Patescibacteria group bacterium]|jgi:predicted O-methyltransferase YrrM